MDRPEVLVSLWNGKAGWAAVRVWIEAVPAPGAPGRELLQVRAHAGHESQDWTMRTNRVDLAIAKARQIVEHTAGDWRDVTG